MRTWKKVISVLLSLAMLLSLCVVGASAEEINSQNALQAAISAAQSDETIALSDNITLDESLAIASDKNIILDLAGHTITLTGTEAHAIVVEGTLEIKDSVEGGKIENTSGSASSPAGTIQVSGGAVTLTSGSIQNAKGYGIFCKDGGSAVVNGGTISCLDSAIAGNNTTGDMNVTVSGGTLIASEGPAIYMPSQVSLNVTGGTLTGGVSLRMGQVNISGGTFTGSTNSNDSYANGTYGYSFGGNNWLGDALFVQGGAYGSENESYGNSLNLTISGGKFSAASGKSIGIYDAGKVSQTMSVQITGGTFDKDVSVTKVKDVVSSAELKSGYGVTDNVGNGVLSISGGTFSTEPDASYVADGLQAMSSNGKFVVGTPAASIDNKNYATLQEAVKAVTNGQTITVLKDINSSGLAADFEDNGKGNVILDLNGFELKRTCNYTGAQSQAMAAIYVDSNTNVTIKDSSTGKTGKVTGALANSDVNALCEAVMVGYSGTVEGHVTLEGGTYDGSYAAICVQGNSTPGGNAVNAVLTVKGGAVVKGNEYGIRLYGNGATVNIAGGSIAPRAADSVAIIGNGTVKSNEDNGHTSITISGGTITGGDVGIYHPQSGTLSITGGTIVGKTALEVKSGNATVSVTGDPILRATGAVSHTANGNGNSSCGYAVALVENSAYTGDASVTISGGKFTGPVAKLVDSTNSSYTYTMAISGGYFTDNSALAYLEDGHKVVSDASVAGYSYQVVEKGAEDAKVVAPAASGSNAVKIPTGTTEEVAAAINAAANKVANTAPVIETPQALVGVTSSDSNATTVPAQTEAAKTATAEALNALTGISNVTANDVTLVVQPEVNVKVSEVKLDDSKNVTAIKVNIDATYKTLATTATIANGDAPISAGTNAVEVTGAGTSGSLTVNTPVKLTIAIPDGLGGLGTNGLMVQHDKNGNVHYHAGNVSGSNGSYTLTFTTTDGFSPFVISAADQRVLAINGTNYTISDVGSALPAATQSGYGFNGWTFAGVSGTYTSLTNDLWNVLNGSVALNVTTPTVKTATASFTQNSGSTGGSSAAATYSITVSNSTNGTVKSNVTNAAKGTKVTLTATPATGYTLDTLMVKDASGNSISTTKASATTYTFTMPASKVTVSATFKAGTTAMPFTDVASDYWAYSQIEWAYNNGYMNGKTTTTFVPAGTVNRQQLWMVLARLSGAAPADMAAAKDWAIANNISDGSNPTGAVSRQQMATMLYRYATLKGYAVSGTADLTTFSDSASVASYAADAMTWAVASGIIGGTSDGKLNPAGSTTRAQFAVMLNRFCDKITA